MYENGPEKQMLQAVLMVDRMISPFTLTLGPVLFVIALVRSNVESWDEVVTTVCIFLMWLLFSRTLRMLPHFYRCPGAPRRDCST